MKIFAPYRKVIVAAATLIATAIVDAGLDADPVWSVVVAVAGVVGVYFAENEEV